MKTNRLSSKLQAALNIQMTQEAYASQVYLSYGVWAASEGYNGISNFLFRHANEERNHMMKFLEYILERGGTPVIDAIAKAPGAPENMQDCFEQVFKQEIGNTKGIYEIVKMSFEESDWATWNFIQWFVKEQTEEETLAMNLLDKIKIAGGKKASDDALYNLDRDLEKMPDEAALAEEKSTTNP